MMASAPLAIDDEAWCLLTIRSGKQRDTLIGVATVRIVEVAGDVFHAEILRASLQPMGIAHPFRVGALIEKPRDGLWACADRSEKARFVAHVRRFWPSEAR